MASSVKCVVATHWHDDHIAGISELFSRAEKAQFWCSAALTAKEWLTLVELHSSNLLPGGSGVTEMRAVMNELERRAGNSRVAAPNFAMQGMPVFSRPAREGIAAEVTAYAPSAPAILAMHKEFALRLQESKSRRSRLPTLAPNDGSVVLSVSVGSVKVLLGADLEERGKGGLGWSAVLEHTGSNQVTHEGYKIPHHGSANGHHPNVWPALMTGDAWAVVTPWRCGANSLPLGSDALRILNESQGNAYITAPPHRAKYRHPDPAVKRTLWEMGVELKKDMGKQGHIRLRRFANPQGEWQLELYGNACPLAKVQFNSFIQ